MHHGVTKRRYSRVNMASTIKMECHNGNNSYGSCSQKRGSKKQRLLPMYMLLNGLCVQTSSSPVSAHVDSSVRSYESRTAPTSPQHEFSEKSLLLLTTTAPNSPTQTLPLISPSAGVNVQSLFSDYFDSLSFIRVSSKSHPCYLDGLDTDTSDRFW